MKRVVLAPFGHEVVSRIRRGAGARIYLVREPVTGLRFAPST
ncbi:MAG: hypothetical protein QM753_07530 [Thermomicrobiales bacterium]